MFRLIAGLCRTMVVANTGGTFALLIIFMLGGFIIPKPQIKPWWLWGYWSSPVTYAEIAITVNEFLAPQWAKVLKKSIASSSSRTQKCCLFLTLLSF
jgi:ABC-type multidrug transport system permease subunit